MKARVFITLKNGVLDPQGKAIHHALEGFGFSGVNDVRAGKRMQTSPRRASRHPSSPLRTCQRSSIAARRRRWRRSGSRCR